MPKPVSEWAEASDATPTGEQPEASGLISDSPLVELLGYAFNRRFSGRLVLNSSSADSIGLGFEDGRIISALLPTDSDGRREQAALESYLPPEALMFTAQHANTHGLDLFSAVESLVLLPSESVQLARADFIKRVVLDSCLTPPDTRYAFFPGSAQLAGAVSVHTPPDPLGLILSCIQTEPALERARRSVRAFAHERLSLSERMPIEDRGLSAPCRAWLARLERAPCSYVDLLRLNPAAGDQLVALLYALLIMGLVRMRTGPSEQPRPVHQSRIPRSISSQAVRAVSHATDRPAPEPGASVRSPGPREPDPQSPEAARKRTEQECAAEAKVVQAWMLGEADRTYLERSRLFVGKVVQLFPHNPRIRFCFASLLKRAHELESAIEEFELVLQMDPTNIDAKNELEQLLRRRSSKRPTQRPR